jgi:hypothetical protein
MPRLNFNELQPRAVLECVLIIARFFSASAATQDSDLAEVDFLEMTPVVWVVL